jgi:hypothetical protein
MLHALQIYWDHTTARKEPYIVPQFLQNKRTGVFRKIGHGDIEGRGDGGGGGGMEDERKSEGVEGGEHVPHHR